MRFRRPIVLVALAAALAFPLGVLASHGFTDVPDSNTFHADIDALADAGVTTGCAAGKYCPKEFLTREQMAAFLNRLGALGPGKTPVVNATKLDGKDATDFLSGDIVMMESGAWTPSVSSSVSIASSDTATRVAKPSAGGDVVLLSLSAPAAIGGQAYGLKSVDVCFGVSAGAGVTLNYIEVQHLKPAGMVIEMNDPTDYPMTSVGCVHLVDGTPNAVTGGMRVSIALTYAGSGAANLTTTIATWSPIP